jgi:hypothetical protein
MHDELDEKTELDKELNHILGNCDCDRLDMNCWMMRSNDPEFIHTLSQRQLEAIKQAVESEIDKAVDAHTVKAAIAGMEQEWEDLGNYISENADWLALDFRNFPNAMREWLTTRRIQHAQLRKDAGMPHENISELLDERDNKSEETV